MGATLTEIYLFCIYYSKRYVEWFSIVHTMMSLEATKPCTPYLMIDVWYDFLQLWVSLQAAQLQAAQTLQISHETVASLWMRCWRRASQSVSLCSFCSVFCFFICSCWIVCFVWFLCLFLLCFSLLARFSDLRLDIIRRKEQTLQMLLNGFLLCILWSINLRDLNILKHIETLLDSPETGPYAEELRAKQRERAVCSWDLGW